MTRTERQPKYEAHVKKSTLVAKLGFSNDFFYARVYMGLRNLVLRSRSPRCAAMAHGLRSRVQSAVTAERNEQGTRSGHGTHGLRSRVQSAVTAAPAKSSVQAARSEVACKLATQEIQLAVPQLGWGEATRACASAR